MIAISGWQRLWLKEDFRSLETTAQKTSFKSENIQTDEVKGRSRKFDESSEVGNYTSLIKNRHFSLSYKSLV